MKNSKRILKVTVKKILDDSPDTSYLGEYSQTRTSEFSIDRAHAEDCASVRSDIQIAKQTLEHVQQTIGDLHNAVLAQYNGTLANEKLDAERTALDDAYDLVGELFDTIDECDCNGHGDMGRNEYQYFNPSFNYVNKQGKPTDGLTPDEVRKYTRQDYERMESLNAGNWYYIGIRAEAEYTQGLGVLGGTIQKLTSGGLWGIESDSDVAYIKSVEQEELSNLKLELVALGFSKRAISQAFKSITEVSE